MQQLSLSYCQGLSRYAYVLSVTGRSSEALPKIEKAMSLSPDNADLLVQVNDDYVNVQNILMKTY